MKGTRDFANVVQLEFAVHDIRRYQAAYLAANGTPITVRWKKGWFAIGDKDPKFVRPTAFRNMTDVLEKRAREGKP